MTLQDPLSEKRQHAEFLIQRYDNSYESVNTKGAFYIELKEKLFTVLPVVILALLALLVVYSLSI